MADQLPRQTKIKITELEDRLKSARIRRGLKLKDLAQAAGISESTAQKIEKNIEKVAFGNVARYLYAAGLVTEIDSICAAERDLLQLGKIRQRASTIDDKDFEDND